MPEYQKDCNTPKVLEIHSRECPVLFHRVTIPAELGDDEAYPPRPGLYRNALVVYEANNHVWLYSSDGIPTFVSDGGRGVDDYNELENKPSINGHELVGNSSLGDIGVDDAIDEALSEYTPTDDLADVALSGDYNDLSNTPTIPTVNDATLTVSRNNSPVGTFTANSATDTTIDIAVPTKTSDITNDSGFITNTVNDLTNYYTKTETDSAIGAETTNRENADQDLQEQIDAITSSSDVVDVVGTYAELQAYDTSHLGNNDIIKVLTDETHDNAISYYRWSTATNTFSYIGSQGPFYTKAETDATFVPQTRTVNNKALSTNITLTAADVGALPASTVIPTVNDATLTIQKNGSTVTTFTANSSQNATANITVPTKVSDITNDLNFVEESDLADVAFSGDYADLTGTPTIPTKTSDLTNDSNFVSDANYVHTDNNFTTTEKNKLAGIAAGAEVNVQSDWAQTNSSADDFIKNKPTIPAAQVNSDWNAVSGVAQILNKPTIPTATSQLTNDSGFITGYTETDPIFTASPAHSITNADITAWNNKSDFSGDYNDLTNKPTIPTVNDATLTIQKNGTAVGTFTANSATNKTVNITVPEYTAGSGIDITNNVISATANTFASYSNGTLYITNSAQNADTEGF